MNAIDELKFIAIGRKNRAKNFCRAGHPVNAENSRIRADGSRECVTCRRIREGSVPLVRKPAAKIDDLDAIAGGRDIRPESEIVAVEAVLYRLCEAFSRILSRRGEGIDDASAEAGAIIPKKPRTHKALILKALTENPNEGTNELAMRIGTVPVYVSEIKRQMRREGKL